MIDIHAHILPGLDDGAADMDSALAMAAMAVESGVRAIIATPHCNIPGQFDNYRDERLAQAFRTFRDRVKQAGIPVEIWPGMEIFGTPDVPGRMEEKRFITLAGSRYPLVEFPFQGYADRATEVLRGVSALGLRPIVAHPERYGYVQREPAILNLWTEMGCLLQINKGSLLGRFGRTAQHLALGLVDRGFAAFAASDAHSPEVRTTWMGDVRALLEEEFSPETARLLLEENPARVLADRDIRMEEPEWF